jgi:hypothetical protein
MSISDELNRVNLIYNLKDKCKDIPLIEKMLMGDTLMDAVKSNPVLYRRVDFRFYDDDDNEEAKGSFLFPDFIYNESLQALKDILNNKCNCPNPEESHKWCFVDLETTYGTLDTWYKYSSDHIMSNPKRIREIAEELECPYKLLSDEELMREIIDWIDTDESLGWSSIPDRRKHFVIPQYEHDNFNPDDDYKVLFDMFCSWIRIEINLKLFHQAHSLIYCFGTTNSYRKIRSGNKRYYVPYLKNIDSLDYLEEKINKEREDHDIYKNLAGPMYSDKCRCGIITSYDKNGIFDGKHNSYIYTDLITQEGLLLSEKDTVIKDIIKIYDLYNLLKDTCPYYYIDNFHLITI